MRIPWTALELLLRPPDVFPTHDECELARQHGLLPLLPSIARADRVALMVHEGAVELRRRDLLDVSDALRAAGVEHMPVKGAVLGEMLYGSHRLRDASDIDLMVKPDALEPALSALKRTGAVHLESSYTRGRVEMLKAPRGTLVELHVDLSVDARLRRLATELWRDPKQYACLGRTFTIPQPEPYFVYLLVHLARHGAAPRAIWFVDLLRFVDLPLSWPEIHATAERARVHHGVLLGALALQSVLERLGRSTRIPEDILARLRRQESRVARWVRERVLFRGGPRLWREVGEPRVLAAYLTEELDDLAYIILRAIQRRVLT